jgi:hypothetical protein
MWLAWLDSSDGVGGAIAVDREGGAARRRCLSDMCDDGVKESRRRYR